jgi:hypothetical protein
VLKDSIWYVQACSVKALQFMKHFRVARRGQKFNINIPITREKKKLKTFSVHSENNDLIFKIIKKAKISCVRVSLRTLKCIKIEG